MDTSKKHLTKRLFLLLPALSIAGLLCACSHTAGQESIAVLPNPNISSAAPQPSEEMAAKEAFEGMPPLEEISAKQAEMGWDEYGAQAIYQHLLKRQDSYAYSIEYPDHSIGKDHFIITPDDAQYTGRIDMDTHWDNKDIVIALDVSADAGATLNLQSTQDILTAVILFADIGIGEADACASAHELLDSLAANGFSSSDTMDTGLYTIDISGDGQGRLTSIDADYKFNWLRHDFAIDDYTPAEGELTPNTDSKLESRHRITGIVEKGSRKGINAEYLVRSENGDAYALTTGWEVGQQGERMPLIIKRGQAYSFYVHFTHPNNPIIIDAVEYLK